MCDSDDDLQDLNESITSTPILKSRKPFSLPTNSEVFETKEAIKIQKERMKQDIMKKTLPERTNELVSPIPPLPESLKYKYKHLKRAVSFANDQSEIFHGRISEFVQGKREVFIVQLLINKKQEEMNRLNKQMKKTELNYIDAQKEIKGLGRKYKNEQIALESNLSNGRKLAEAARTKRSDLQKSVKMKSIKIDNLKIENSKHEELREIYYECYRYLDKMNPGDCSPLEYFHHPSVLVERILRSEDENKFLNDQIDHHDSTKSPESNPQLQISQEIQAQIDQIQDESSKLVKSIDYQLDSTHINKLAMSEKFIEDLSNMISKVYLNCFNFNAQVPPLEKLRRIDVSLENFYSRVLLLNPKLVEEKRVLKEKERREIARDEGQALKEKIQQEKKEQILIRATQPPRKLNGRPIKKRQLPIKAKKENLEKKLRKQIEAYRQDQLLYGTVEETY